MIVRDQMKSESEYLKTEDLDGKPHVVVISDCQMVTVKDRQSGEEKQKPALSFSGKKKKLTLNITNILSIEQIVGSGDSDDWLGKSIELFPTTCPLASGITPCIRIRPPSIQQAPALAPVAAPYVQPPVAPAPPVLPQEDPTDYGQGGDDIPF